MRAKILVRPLVPFAIKSRNKSRAKRSEWEFRNEFASRFSVTKSANEQKTHGAIFARAPSPFVCFFFPHVPSPSLSLSFSLPFLFNPGGQSTAEAETAELSSTLIRDRGTSTTLTTPFDPSNRPAATGRGEYCPLGHLRHLCQKFERERILRCVLPRHVPS